MKNQKGLTLLELLVVIAIMAILIGIVALSLGGVIGNATTVAQAAELENLQTAIETYNTMNVAVEGWPAITSGCYHPDADPVYQGDGCFGEDFPCFAIYVPNQAPKWGYAWDDEGANLRRVDGCGAQPPSPPVGQPIQ